MKLLVRWAVALVCAAGSARAADEKTLDKLVAPTPAEIGTPFTGKTTQPIKLTRLVVQLKPEPWAVILVQTHGDSRTGAVVGPQRRVVEWQDGQQIIKTSTLSPIVDEELARAGARNGPEEASVFTADSRANLQLGARVTDIEARLCQYCGWDSVGRWTGAVTMTVRWEIYSSIDRKVVAAIETSGGFNQGKPGLEGSGERLVNEAFRDNVRRLIASPDFQHALSAPPGGVPTVQARKADEQPINLVAARIVPSPVQATASVATVFANDGSGSGFLISDDGYLLTNQHVVGVAKYVKLKWPDGKETLGEVIRSDARRDIALVKTDPGGRPALSLRLAKPQMSETVFALGSPFGDQFQGSLSKGIVSSLRTIDGLDLIQSDVAVNHGNSGGPLLDESGRVIGLTDWGRMENGVPVGVNLFIPIDDALRTLNLIPPTPAAPTPPQHTATASKARAKP
ncbi:S1C family serine protease [Phenylobacterium sp.]|jgi:S1-C subfamily serine protease|uniref:S1C family serine protease n=1 Tax=Phenylobacterium sp. TaxID=1871053 RepID=UPI002F4151E3